MDLKKLNRKQLLELLLKQTMRVEELEQQLLIKDNLIQEMEQKLNEMDLIRQAKGMLEEMEKNCAVREAEAEKKIKEANSIIVRVEGIIASSKNNGSTEKSAVENTHSEKKEIPKKKSESKDILDDFFSGVIGNK